jgi:hypothetical protein
LNQDNSVDPWEAGVDYGRFLEMKLEKQDNVEYIYAFYNDGRSRKNYLDHIHLRKEYMLYKDWHDQIKTKTIDTLKLAVSRLLLDFDNNTILRNQVNLFDESQKETKTASLRRLAT